MRCSQCKAKFTRGGMVLVVAEITMRWFCSFPCLVKYCSEKRIEGYYVGTLEW
jgi:hypothetical protein